MSASADFLPRSLRQPSTTTRLLLLVLCGLAALWLGFLTAGPDRARRWVSEWGYYSTAVTFGLWLWALGRAGIFQLTWAALRHRTGQRMALAAAGLTLVAALTTPYHYKVLFDELVLQSTALNMSRLSLSEAMGRAYELDGRLQLVQGYLDKRPLFHPFLISLLHSFTGVREANAFLLNTLLMPVILLLTAALGRLLAGSVAAWTALVSLGAFSLLALNATGAGMEMLNLALFVGVALAATWYLQNPSSERLAVLVLTAVLLANTRYESSMYIFCTALVILEGWRRAARVVLPATVILAPLLLVPYALHNIYLSSTPVLWELREGQAVRFSAAYFSANLEFAKTFFFNFGPEIANSPWLTWAGLLSVVGWFVWRLRRRLTWSTVPAAEWAVTAMALGVVANLGLLLSYYWGDLSDPIVSRLSLPLHALLALAVGAAAAWLAARGWRWIGIATPVAALAAYMAWGLPTNKRLPPFYIVDTAQRWENAFIASLPPKSRLVITDKSPLFWFARNTSSFANVNVQNRLEAIAYHWQRHTFDEILVLQRLGPTTSAGELRLEPSCVLPDAIELEPLAETRIGARIQRISRVREIRVDAPPANSVNLAKP